VNREKTIPLIIRVKFEQELGSASGRNKKGDRPTRERQVEVRKRESNELDRGYRPCKKEKKIRPLGRKGKSRASPNDPEKRTPEREAKSKKPIGEQKIWRERREASSPTN